MTGVILAAGKGSRLGNHTSDTPKSLLKLNDDQTLLDYNIAVLKKLGIEKIYIVTGFNSGKIEEHVKSDQIECVFNPFWNSCNVLGSLYMVLPYINDDFLFLHADTLVGFEVWEKLFSHEGDIVMPFKRKICGEEEMKVRLDNTGNLLEVNKTMDEKNADGEFLGIAKFSESITPYIKEVSEQLFKTGRLDFYMEAAVEEAIKDKKGVKAFDIGEAKFIEVDFEEDYLLAQKTFTN
ncbi:MAG: phosphocholine cytidylyltransferase family protein [Niabella sp.]